MMMMMNNFPNNFKRELYINKKRKEVKFCPNTAGSALTHPCHLKLHTLRQEWCPRRGLICRV